MQTSTGRQWLPLRSFLGVLGLFGLVASVQAQPVKLTACGTISTSGVYVVQNDLTATASDCLSIAADAVTIDLGGHTLTGDGSTFSGLVCTAGFQGLEIRNGVVTNFGGAGISIDQCPNSRVSGVQAIANPGAGIRVGSNSEVGGCLALDNGATGVEVTGGSSSVNGTISNGNDVGMSAAVCPGLFLGNVATGNTTANLTADVTTCVVLNNVAP